MPCTRIKERSGHYSIYQSTSGKRYAVHRLVAEAFERIDEVVHHIDGNILNNIPQNLQGMTRSKHSKLHANTSDRLKRAQELGQSVGKANFNNWNTSEKGKRAHSKLLTKQNLSNEDFKAKRLQGFNKKWQDPEFKELHKQRLSTRHKDKQFSQRIKAAASKALAQKWQNPTFKRTMQRSKITKLLILLKQHYTTLTETLYTQHRKSGMVSWKTFVPYYFNSYEEVYELWGSLNHKVRSIRIIETEQPVPVFCLSVDMYHNFALSAGVYTHNCTLDEMNFMQKSKTSVRKKAGEEEYDRALKLYSNITRRLKSRFMFAGKALGKVFLISSRAEPDTFLEKHIKSRRTDKTVYIIDHKTWDVHPPAKFGSDWFYIDLGDTMTLPRIIPKEEEMIYAERWENEQVILSNPTEETVIKIPETYRKDFETDLYNSLRDIAGKATDNMNIFIIDKTSIGAAFNVIADADPVEQHLKSFENVRSTLPVNRQVTNFVDGFYLDLAKLQNKHQPRFIHLDLALKGGIGGDSAGFACCYQDGWQTITRNEISEELPIVRFDFTLEIHANPDTKEIMFADIRSLIYKLQEAVYIKRVSSDGFQSSDIRQTLNARGIEAILFSLDTKSEGYETFKALILNRCLNVPYHKRPYEETLKLERNLKTRKIDHPGGGTKDVTDAIAGAAHQCVLESGTVINVTGVSASVNDATRPEIGSPSLFNAAITSDDLDFTEKFERSIYLG